MATARTDGAAQVGGWERGLRRKDTQRSLQSPVCNHHVAPGPIEPVYGVRHEAGPVSIHEHPIRAARSPAVQHRPPLREWVISSYLCCQTASRPSSRAAHAVGSPPAGTPVPSALPATASPPSPCPEAAAVAVTNKLEAHKSEPRNRAKAKSYMPPEYRTQHRPGNIATVKD
jgi:hypothetical protein